MGSTSRGSSADNSNHLYLIPFKVNNYYGSKGGQRSINENILVRLNSGADVAKGLGLDLLKATAFPLSYQNSNNELLGQFEKFLCWLGRIGAPVESDKHYFDILTNLKDGDNGSVYKYTRHGSWDKMNTDEKGRWKREAFVVTSPNHSDVPYVKESGCNERLQVVQSLYHAKMMFKEELLSKNEDIGNEIMSFCTSIDKATSLDDIIKAWENLGSQETKDILTGFMEHTNSYVKQYSPKPGSKKFEEAEEHSKTRHQSAQERIDKAKVFIDEELKQIQGEVEIVKGRVKSKEAEYKQKVKQKERDLEKQLQNLKRKMRMQH